MYNFWFDILKNKVVRKIHQCFKRKARRNRKREEIKHRRLKDITAWIEYEDVASSDSNNQSENDGSDSTGKQCIVLSEEEESSTEENVQVENSDGEAVDFLEACQLHIAQNENIPLIDHSNEAQDLSLSDDLLIFENDEEKEQYVIESLTEWALESGHLSMKKLDNLLNRLHPVFPNCPKSYKTLLNTSFNIPIIEFENGRLWYKGIKQNLNALNIGEYLLRYGEITIDINIDGLPISHSSTLKFWPILGKLVGTLNEPFIIGLYLGRKDPQNVHDYLKNFVNELDNLFKNGFEWETTRFKFSVRHYILDAPARAFIKCIIGHNGYGACEKCTVVGKWIDNRITFADLDRPLRTDESFLNQDQAIHHEGYSPLLVVETKMVSQFRLDAMHLVYSGVFKRLLMAWLEWKGHFKLSLNAIAAVSDQLKISLKYCPSDFNRKRPDFSIVHFYKSTELRRICIYDGIFVFFGALDSNIYKHYLLLHAAIYILANPVLVRTMHDYANELLKTFILHSKAIYGEKFIVYNVHSIFHLATECAEHGELDSFSAFPFENRLKSIKESLRSFRKPLEQVAKRDLEKDRIRSIRLPYDENNISLCTRHVDPTETIPGIQYKKMIINGVTFQLGQRNSCFKTSDDDIMIMKNIIQRNDNSVYIVANKFRQSEDYYNYPLPSSVLGISKVSRLNTAKNVLQLSDIQAKCWLIPLSQSQSYLSIPLLHTFFTN